MQDEKILETTIEALLGHVQDLKNSCQSFVLKLEQQQLTWTRFPYFSSTLLECLWRAEQLDADKMPQVLDNFALISGQVSTLIKVIKNDRTPVLRNLVVLPLLVQQEQDTDLQKLTEGRIQAFNHEVVPDHLRTKYEPEVEDKERVLSVMATKIPPEVAQRQITNLNSTLSRLIEMIGTARDEWETDQSSASKWSANINADVPKLVGAVTFGKGLSSSSASSGSSSSSHKSSSQARGHSSSSQRQPSSSGKATSSVKTELKNKVMNGTSSPYGTK